MNAKRKGTRREHQAKRMLEADGYAVTRAAASRGCWDLVAIRRDPKPDDYLPVVRLIQVKSGRWARSPEMAVLEADAARYSAFFVRCEVWRFDDGGGEPRIRVVSEGDTST
jgi:uncharacterized protein with GYD domain